MKIIFIAPVSSPFLDMVNRELNKFCKSVFVFHTKPKLRPSWWSNYDLYESSIICKKPREIFRGIYMGSEPLRYCMKFKPNIIVIHASLSPSVWWIALWARYKKLPVILFTEPLGRGTTIFSRLKLFHTKLFRVAYKLIYGNLAHILAVGQITEKYFAENLHFGYDVVSRTQYPVDMSRLLDHPYRKTRQDLTFLFPHRLDPLYDPSTALKWFGEINKLFPATRLIMNGFGVLRNEILDQIKNQNLVNKVSFADKINGWDDLHKVYRSADVILSTKHGLDKDDKNPWGISDWSIAEMDACASGMGLIVSRCSLGLNQIMRKTKSGFIIEDPSDINAVIKAAKSYIYEDNLLYLHGSNVRSAIKKYSVPEYAKNLYKISQNLKVIK